MSTLNEVPIPVDIHRPDRVLFGLTAPQAGAFAATAVLLWGGWALLAAATGTHRPGRLLAGYLVLVGLVMLAVAAIALGRRDGLPLAEWLRAAVAYRRAPRRLAPAAPASGRRESPPPWLRARRARGWTRPPAPWRGPARGVNADGLVDLGRDGTAALLAAETVTFGFLNPAGQARLIGGFTRWLHGIGPRTQILIRTHPVTLSPLAARLDDDARRAASRPLAAALAEQAAFLRGLDADYELLTRRAVIAVRDCEAGTTGRRAAQAAADLHAAGLRPTPLAAPDVLAVLSACLHPYTQAARPGGVPGPMTTDPMTTDPMAGVPMTGEQPW